MVITVIRSRSKFFSDPAQPMPWPFPLPSGRAKWGWGKAFSHRHGAIFAREKYRQCHSLYVWQFVTIRNVTFYCLVLLHTFSRTLRATPGVCNISADTFRFWLWIPARFFCSYAYPRFYSKYYLQYWKLWWFELSANSIATHRLFRWLKWTRPLVLIFEHSENCKLPV